MNLCGYAMIALLLYICLKIVQEPDLFNLKCISTVYVFCYGELINLNTVKQIKKPKESCPVIINDLKRSLNVMGKDNLVFGIKDVKNELCNGVLIKVTPAELTRLQRREKLYTLKTLDKRNVEFPYKKTLRFNSSDMIVAFYPKATYVLTRNELMTKQSFKSQDYLNICEAGAAEISREFYNDFMETTTVI
jgi:hypothetical protein